MTFATYDALRTAAQNLGVELKLDGISAVYSRFRFTWFEVFTGLALLIAPLAAGVFLLRWITRLRKTRTMSPQPA